MEAFVFDTIGTIGSIAIAQLTTRQAMWFVTLSTMKSLDDHCGYKLPWDPFQWLGEQDTEFHDIHHQSWGMKVRSSDSTIGSVAAMEISAHSFNQFRFSWFTRYPIV